MKKVLFATSALVAFAGAAAAEVAVSGDAKLGMRWDSNAVCATCADGEDSAFNVVNRARVKFTMTGQTDSGLEFGATIRADQASTGAIGDGGIRGSGYKGQVWVSGTYGKLTAGDIDSAIVKAVGHLPYVGLSELDDMNEFWYSTSDYDTDQYKEAGLLYEYSINGVKLFASFMDQNLGYTANDRDNNAYSLGAAYEMAGYQFGIGYEKAEVYADPLFPGDYAAAKIDNNTIALSATGAFGEAKVTGIIARTKFDTGVDEYDAWQYGIGAEYKMANGVGLAGFYRRVDNDNALLSGVDGKADILGLGASYDLGGGATLKGGVVNVSAKDGYDIPGVDRTMADVGLDFKF